MIIPDKKKLEKWFNNIENSVIYNLPDLGNFFFFKL